VRVDELTGATIGRYRVGGRLQVLPYASIHRGSVLADGRPVLVWTFREPYATAAGFLEALQKLAGDRRAIRVPGLLQVLEIGVQELRAPLVYLVTEDAAGGFLLSRLQAGRAPGVFAITGPLAKTVDQLHAVGMLHGDIQPATVALAAKGPVLGGHAIRTVVSRVTPAAAWLDITRAFRPPEAPSSAEPVRAGDLWGLAALVYYLLVGRPPSADGRLEAPSQLRPQIPSRVDRAVMRALAQDPSQRFASASEFFAALRGLPPPPGSQEAARPVPPGAGESGTIAWHGRSVPYQPVASTAETREAVAPESAPAPARTGPQPSSRWPSDLPLTPASIRAQSLPYRADGESDPDQTRESTQLIAMEPYRFQPKYRRRGGYLVLWFLAVVVVVMAVLIITHYSNR
jgi:serine/threonine protein kinase